MNRPTAAEALNPRDRHVDVRPMARAAVSPATTLVPPNRLAELLTSTRLAAGIDIREIEERAAGRFSVGELQLIETGGLTLADEDLRAIAALYEIGRAHV